MNYYDPYQRPGEKRLSGAAAMSARVKDLNGLNSLLDATYMRGYRDCGAELMPILSALQRDVAALAQEVRQLKEHI